MDALLREFELREGQSVYAMGSCFAREIEWAFDRSGFQILSFDKEEFNERDFASPHPWGATNFLNRYTTASMLQEIRRLFDDFTLADDQLLLGRGDKFVDLHFGESCTPGDLRLVKRRREISKSVGTRIKQADLVVFTLGLTEAWYDNASEAWMNQGPELHVMRRSTDRFEMRLLGFQDNLQNMERS